MPNTLNNGVPKTQPVIPRRWGQTGRMSDQFLDRTITGNRNALDRMTVGPKDGVSISFFGGFAFVRQHRPGQTTPTTSVMVSDDGYQTMKPINWDAVSYQAQIDLVKHMKGLGLTHAEIGIVLGLPEARITACLNNEQPSLAPLN